MRAKNNHVRHESITTFVQKEVRAHVHADKKLANKKIFDKK